MSASDKDLAMIEAQAWRLKCGELIADNERLRAEDKISHALLADAKAEIGRLQSCLYAQEGVKPLYEEIKRLQAALKQITQSAYHGKHSMIETARRALEQARKG